MGQAEAPAAVNGRNGSAGGMLAQVFVTPLALISTLLVAPSSPAFLLRDRIVETVIGAAVGVAVVLAPTVGRRLRARQPAL
jgi:hypothetical protein